MENSISDDLTAYVSHELRTPLTALKLRLDLLLKLLQSQSQLISSSDAVIEFLEKADEQIDRMIYLVNDLNDASQIETGNFHYHLEEIHLSDMIQSLVDQLSFQFKKAKCPVELILKEDVFVFTDRFRLEQVLTNLFTNAMRYGAHNPVIVRLQTDENSAEVFVEDEGIGIPKTEWESVFDKYRRGNQNKQSIGRSNQDSKKGLGLGLYLAKRIIEGLDGTIEIIESGKRQGTTFRLKLPLSQKGDKKPNPT